MQGSDREKNNKDFILGMRPTCPCCGGGEVRKGRKYTRAKSNKLSRKAKKPKTWKDWK